MRKGERLLLLIALLLFALIVLLIIFNISAEKDSGFTELYFVGGLPKYILNEYEYSFSFAVHNAEKKEMVYEYRILSQADELERGSVQLASNETKIITAAFSAGNGPTARMISVELIEQGQRVHFWTKMQ